MDAVGVHGAVIASTVVGGQDACRSVPFRSMDMTRWRVDASFEIVQSSLSLSSLSGYNFIPHYMELSLLNSSTSGEWGLVTTPLKVPTCVTHLPTIPQAVDMPDCPALPEYGIMRLVLAL
jgi:hypothetical protein